jgi:hypothetical protein
MPPGRNQDGFDISLMAKRMVILQVARIPLRLVKISLENAVLVLELEYDNDAVLKHKHVRSSTTLSRKLIFEYGGVPLR